MLSEKCVGSFMCYDVGYILKSLLHYSVYQKGITNTGSIIGDCCICKPKTALLGVFVKLRKANVVGQKDITKLLGSSVRMEQLELHWTDFDEI